MTSLSLSLPHEPENAHHADDTLRQLLKDHVRTSRNQISPLAEGDTWSRFCHLRDVARQDLSLARLVEGHLDATAILREAGRPVDDQLTYAIWASGGPHATTRVESRDSAAFLCGSKPFCSGANLVDRALVHTDQDAVLVDVAIASAGDAIVYGRDDWAAAAFAGTHGLQSFTNCR